MDFTRKRTYSIPNKAYPTSNIRRYGVSVLALTKDYKGNKINTSYPEEGNMPYSSYRSTLVECQTKNKKRLDNTSKNNQNQQQPNKRQNTGRAYTARHREKKHYNGAKSLCSKCKYHHDGPCAPKCHKCNRFGHLARDCRSSINANTTNIQKGIGASQKATCYECGNQRHYKRDCLEQKNQNHENQLKSTKTRGVVHAFRGGETEQDLCRMFTDHKSLQHILVQKELNMGQHRLLELLSDYDCDIRYHSGKANVVADALSRKEREPPLRVRALVMTIGLDLPSQILNAQTRARKPEDIKKEDVGGISKHENSTCLGLRKKYRLNLKNDMLPRDNNSDHEDANEHIEKVIEIVDLFHIPIIAIYKVKLRAFPMSLTRAASHWIRNKPSGSITTWEDLKIKFLIKYCPPARTAKKMEEINNFQQEPDENLYQAWERFKELLMKSRTAKTSDELSAIQAQLNNLGREIKKVNEKVYAAQVGCELWGYKAITSRFCQRNNMNPSYQERRKSMEDTLSKFMSESTKRHEEKSNLIKEIQALMDVAIRNKGAPIKTLEIQIGQMSKVLHERGFGSLSSSTKTYSRDHVKSISTIVEADTSSIRRTGASQYAVSTRQNRASVSVMPLLTYLNLGLGGLAQIKLTVELAYKTVKYPKGIAKNVLVEVRRNQVDDLMPTTKEGEVVEEFRAKNDARMVSKFFGYPSDCDHDKKICIDCSYNLKFYCMIDFAILEDIDGYRNEGIGDVIFGEPFLREVGIKAKRFKGMITIHSGNESVTYQMVLSHPRIQKLVSQLELLEKKLSQEDVNQKLLQSLAYEWNAHAVVWRNKDDLDTMSMDDLYNNLKVYETEVKGMSSSSSSIQNMAFVSSSNNNTGSTNGAVNTAHGVSTTSTQVNAAYSTDIDNLSDDVICAFFASQPNSPQLVHDGLQQIHPDDIEEIDLRRLGHLNFRTMNKLVKGNLVRGLPSKLFENDQTSVACQKGKQHRAAYHLGKFDGKADEGFFVGYSLNSKAFRVFNSRTRLVQENLHIRFSESTPNVVGNGPDWLFDIDALTRTMNYEPIVADLKSSHNDGSKPISDDGKKVNEDPRNESEYKNQKKEDNVNNNNNVNTTDNVNTVSSTINATGINKVSVVGGKISIELPFDQTMTALEDDSIFDFSSDDEDDGAVADMNNLDITIQVSPILTMRIPKDHPLDQVIEDLQSAT
uniref:Putative reverse transcriptase domain-containing protein n=1 Tax=Tanacetum cinerariifolium TaxID=118510 RepID=A0A6L2KR35_TANCI|nr:putative reverse transcriptase domain-containing protein [Tanacetum cinerariifolium]